MYSRLSASRKSIVLTVKRFLKDRTGNVGLIVGLAALPIVLSAGAAVDMIRSNNERTVFKNALDGAALAVGADKRSAYEPDATKRAAAEAALNTVANTWLNKNYNNATGQATAKVKLRADGKGLEVSGTLKFPTTIMKLAGVDSFDMDSTSELTFAPKPMEIVLVLDTTGSMSAEIPSLKRATYNFLRTLYGLPKDTSSSPVPLTSTELTQTTNSREYVRLAIVPFAGAVRLDTATPGVLNWIDRTGANPLSTVNFANTNLVSGASALNNYTAWGVLNKTGGGKHAWNGCVEGRQRSNNDSLNYLANDEPPVAGSTLFPAYFVPDGVSFSASTSRTYNRDWSTGGPAVRSTTTTFYDPAYLAASNRDNRSSSYISGAPNYNPTVPTQTKRISGTNYTVAYQDTNNYPIAPLPNGYTIPLPDVSGAPNVRHSVALGTSSIGDLTGIGYGTVEQRITNTNRYFTSNTLAVQNVSNPSSTSGPWNNCAMSPIVSLTHDPAKINAGIGLLQAYGGTNIMEGLAWGMRVISPTAPYTTAGDLPSVVSPATDTGGLIAPYHDTRWSKILVLMSDGQNDPYARSNGTPVQYADFGASYNAYGRSTANVAANKNRYGTNDFNALPGIMDADTLKICTLLKNNGVQLYTIGFGVDNEMLKQCATQPTAPYYQYETSTDLSAVFDHIGKDVLSKNIYISK